VVAIENEEHKSQEIAWHISQNLVILIYRGIKWLNLT
jgi:hypothetical protein